MVSKYMKSVDGEYLYLFNFVNEHGSPTGFNDIWAPNKREAYKRACKKFNRKAYEHKQYGHIDAILVSYKTLKKATAEMWREQNRLGWLMSN